MKTCLITGINSFTAKYVKQVFEQDGYKVLGTVLKDSALSNNADIYKMDLLNPDQVRDVIIDTKPDVIIHLAGISFILGDNADLYYQTHIIGTRNLLNAVDKAKIPIEKILLASSGQVYGSSNETGERSIVYPKSDYAVSKIAMEYMAKLWMDRLPIIIARPFNYTGIGQSPKFVIPKIVNAFLNKNDILPLGNTNVYRDFSDVRFISQSYLALAKNAVVGETYNLCSGMAISLNEIIADLTMISGHNINIKIVPEFIRKKEQKTILGDNTKFSKIMDAPRIIPMRKTLEWMYHSCK